MLFHATIPPAAAFATHVVGKERTVTAEQHERRTSVSICNARLWHGKSAWIDDETLANFVREIGKVVERALETAKLFCCWTHMFVISPGACLRHVVTVVCGE